MGCVPAATAGGTDSGHRDDPGGQDPHRHLFSEQCPLVSGLPMAPSVLPPPTPAPVGLLWGVEVEREKERQMAQVS